MSCKVQTMGYGSTIITLRSADSFTPPWVQCGLQKPQLVLLEEMSGASFISFVSPGPQYPGVPLAAPLIQVAHQPTSIGSVS